MLERLEAARALGNHDPARSLQSVTDRDLAGGGGIEPRDRLVGADELGALAPQRPDFLLPEVVAAGRARGDRAGRVLVELGGIEGGVLECHLRRGQRHVRPAIGLHLEALLDEVVRVELARLARQRGRVAARVEMGDGADAAATLERRVPPGVGPHAVRGDHADPRDQRASAVVGLGRGHADTSRNSSGSEKIIAD